MALDPPLRTGDDPALQFERSLIVERVKFGRRQSTPVGGRAKSSVSPWGQLTGCACIVAAEPLALPFR